MSLRPPSSPSPSPGPHENSRSAARQSLGPSTRVTPMPASPRTGVRPTSELVVPSSAMYQEVDAMDQWFENLQNYDATLEEMAAASMDVNFKEELSAIEQWFKVLSEAERTAALYSLLQHSTQVQIRFFITVLQAMARADPMTALLSPAVGGSMQNQMEAKLAGLKSPGLKSGLPGSPTTRNFGQSAGAPSNNRQSLVLDNSSNFLSPESAGLAPSSDAASTLAQRRAELKASNASHRISAPVLASSGDNRGPWGGAGQLSQVAEQNAPAADSNGTTSRPKSTEFTGSPRLPPASQEQTITTTESWANMVNTPLIPMFQKKDTKPPAQATEWSSKPTTSAPGVPKMGDPTIHRKRNPDYQQQDESQQGRFRNDAQARNAWGPARSPALNNGNLGGMPLGGFGNLGAMGSPNGLNGMGMVPNMNMGGMNPMTSPFAGLNMNMLSAMGITPEAVLAAQMAASGQFGGQPGWMGMQPPNSGGLRNRNGPPSGRSVGPKSATSVTSVGTSGGTPKDPEDVDPSVLHDIPAWLRSLRLHKYTPNFEHMRWQDMVLMDEAALEAKGVAALGARRKMLKTFELVRKKMGIDGGPPSSIPPSATLRSP